MLKRVLFGLLAGVFVGGALLLNPRWLSVVNSFVSILLVWEIYHAVGFGKNHKWLFILFVACFLIVPIGSFFSETGYWRNIAFFVLLYLLSLFFCYLFTSITYTDLAKMFVSVLYICLPLACLSFIRVSPHGVYTVWLPILAASSVDIFAYFFGLRFGRHKLFPQISPKKTVEGALGGIFMCCLVFYLFYYIMHNFLFIELTLWKILLLGFLASVSGIIGDLVASKIKREYNLKDFGGTLPGHGGFLDRADSCLFIAPLVYTWIFFVGL